MKPTLLCLLLVFMLGFSSFANNTHRVTANSLNVRSSPSTNSRVIGKLYKGNAVDVRKFKTGWAKIYYKNQFCYISSKYITPLVRSTNSKHNKEKSYLDKYNLYRGQNIIFVHIAMILSIILLIYRLIFNKDPKKQIIIFADDEIEKNGVIIPSILLAIICILEMYYFVILKGDTSFCSYSKVGFIYMVINFIFFCLMVINQIYSFTKLAKDFSAKSSFVNYKVFHIGSTITVLAIFAKVLFWEDPKAEQYILIFYGIIIFLQSTIILNMSKRHIGYAIFQTLLFIIFATGTMVLLYIFIPILMIAFLIIIVGIALIGGAGSTALLSSGSSNNDSSGSSDYTHQEKENRTVTDENGYTRELEDLGYGDFKDDKGNLWEKSGWDGVKRKE